jgi:hypothetical protein
MKKLIAVAVLLLAGPAMADQVTKSSTTLTNESGYIAARQLVRVLVGATSANGVLKIYNSTYTTSGLISSATLVTGNALDFENLNVKGIYYVTTGNTNGLTIIYRQ